MKTEIWWHCCMCNARTRTARRPSADGDPFKDGDDPTLTELPPAYCGGCGSSNANLSIEETQR